MTNPILYGTDNADFIVDPYGPQDIKGLGGNDYIVAEDDDDYLEIIDGGAGSDTVSYAQLQGVYVNLGPIVNGYGLAYDTGDLLNSVENLVGSNQDDRFLANEVSNELYGMGGNDFFEGRGGADKIAGGDGFDTATYEHAWSGVTINLENGRGYIGEAQGDQLFSIEHLIGSSYYDQLQGSAADNLLEGGAGADILEGRAGNDELVGGSGADDLYGGQGADALTGGTGADTFIFMATGESSKQSGLTDTITDFNYTTGDRIDLSDIDAQVHPRGNQAFSYIGDHAFTHEGQISAHAVDGGMAVAINTDGNSGTDMSFLVSDATSITSNDFIL